LKSAVKKSDKSALKKFLKLAQNKRKILNS